MEGEEREAVDAGGPVAGMVEGEGVGGEEEVEDAVDEGVVDGYEHEDGLREYENCAPVFSNFERKFDT